MFEEIKKDAELLNLYDEEESKQDYKIKQCEKAKIKLKSNLLNILYGD